MGSHSVSHRVPQQYKTEQDLRGYWRQYIDRLTIEEGTDCYNGTFTTCRGLKVETKVFEDEVKADEYILERTQKWEHALAVRVNTVHYDYSQVEKDEKLQALRSEKREADRHQSNVAHAVLMNMHKGAATRTCRCCKSKISMSWTEEGSGVIVFQSATCPVCKAGSMLLKGELAAISKAKAPLHKLELKVADREKAVREKLKANGKAVEYWYVAGWAAS